MNMSFTPDTRNLSPKDPLSVLKQGTFIPAHPLALDMARKIDRRRQKALSRYYMDAGAGGLAVGVHTTQFAIREAGLYEDVLSLAAETVVQWSKQTMVMVAGIAGATKQAVNEAQTAHQLGYHAGLLSLAALKGQPHDALLEHCRAIGEEIPLVGFYLQPAVGGMELDAEFWTRFASIPNVVAIKVAGFNRYRSLDVIRGVVNARAEDRIALYTGNDDHIVLDLVTPFKVMRDGEMVTVRFVGGLLGHWSVWTKTAVEIYNQCRKASCDDEIASDLLALDSRVTDCNSAFFDVANNFYGCIAGCHEVLRRQGLLEDIWCLDPNEKLSQGQMEEIDRVYEAHQDLNDDAFVQSNLERWMS
jgi:dihydrodipicolinate synthase/N-acetylneuraminate lyase